MNTYLIVREYGDYSWGDNYEAVVIAEDKLHAEEYARLNVTGWKNAKLRTPIEIEMDKEQVILVENVRA